MKKITILLLSIVISGSAFAQQDFDYLEVSREVLKVEKKALIAEVMQLTEAESPANNNKVWKRVLIGPCFFWHIRRNVP